jgi:hypothetical protein
VTDALVAMGHIVLTDEGGEVTASGERFKRVSNSRALQLTSSGRAGLSEIFQIEINNEGAPTGRLSDSRRLTA